MRSSLELGLRGFEAGGAAAATVNAAHKAPGTGGERSQSVVDVFEERSGIAVLPDASGRLATDVVNIRDMLLYCLSAARGYAARGGAGDHAAASYELLDAAYGFVQLGKFDAALKTLRVATRAPTSEIVRESACNLAAQAYLGKCGIGRDS